MNDFDALLEHGLRQLLDPVVARRPPVRRGQLRRTDPVLSLVPTAELAVEPAPVTAPVVAAPATPLLT